MSTPDHDPVMRPSHYTQGSIQCIEAIEAALSPEEFRGYLRGNALKYLWRLPHKGNPVQDCGKAAWYLQRLAERSEEVNESKPVHETNDATPPPSLRRWAVAWQEQGEPIRRRVFGSEADAEAFRASVAWNPSCMTWMIGPDEDEADVVPASLPSPARTATVTPHSETLMRPLEPGGELCVRNESGRDVIVSVGLGRLAKYLEEHYGYEARIVELERERDELRRRFLTLCRQIDSSDPAAMRAAWETAARLVEESREKGEDAS